MPQPERDPTFTQTERLEAQEETRRERRRLLGEQAMIAFTVLPEIETSYDWERNYLRSRIVGQEGAIDAIISALDRSEVRNSDDNRPMANFAFLGPTGVGKTETAKVLSEVLSQGDARLLRIDCSNFSHGHEVASLTGSPPGYVGREQKPILSPERVESYGTVVLFDEIEKGSPQLTNLLLQIMDNGLLELSNGETVSFKETIVVMTSNLGAKEMAREAGGNRPGFGLDDATPRDKATIDTAALKGFKDFFSPEFVNRLDNLVVFHPLDEHELHEVLEVKLNKMNSTYIDDYGAFIGLSEMTRRHLVDQALKDRAYGVRPLVRALEKDIASGFGRYAAHDKIEEGTEVYVYHRDEVDAALVRRHKGELVFASRPDASIKKKVAPAVTNLGAFFASNSANLVVVNPPVNDDKKEE